MRITRLVHSCLLIEHDEVRVLIDPGNFSFDDERIDVTTHTNIDHVLITHSHDDHCSLPFIQQLIRQSPDLTIHSNQEVADKLQAEGITVSQNLPDFVSATTRQHASLWRGAPVPLNTIFTLWDRITIFGDNREIDAVPVAEVVVFPIVAPWGSLVDAIDRILAHAPKKIIPVHDWHLSEAGKQWYQARMKDALQDSATTLLQMSDTDSIDI